MGIELCGKCHGLHYVPGPCPTRSAGNVAASAGRLHSRVSVATESTSSVPVDTTIIGKRRGRPQTITDMKAYRAQKARERRAALKPKRLKEEKK